MDLLFGLDTNPSLMYWILLGTGFFILLVSFLLDGIFNFGDDGSITPAIGVFLTLFGSTGIVALNMFKMGVPGSVLTALVVSTVGSAGFYFGVLRVLYGHESTMEDRREDLVGKTAEVSVGMSPESLGQITFVTPSGRTTASARPLGNKTIRQGTLVQVVSCVGTVYVVKTMEEEDVPLKGKEEKESANE